MVYDVFGYWTLSKGSIEESETPEQGTVRELKEEIGLDITILEKLGENEYVAHHPERGPVRKHVIYFLAKADFVPLQLEVSGGLKDAKWFELAEIGGLTMYDDIAQIMTMALEKVVKL